MSDFPGDDLLAEIEELWAQITERDDAFAELRLRLAERDATIAELRAQVATLTERLSRCTCTDDFGNVTE